MSCPDQDSNLTLTTWIELLDSSAGGEDLSNAIAGDLEVLDVFVVNGTRIRVFYTTEGFFDSAANVLRPGRLRPVDIVKPIPDLASFGFANQFWDAGGTAWDIRDPVAKWNDVLHPLPNPNPDDPPFAKGNALVGFAVRNGWLFVNGPHRNDKDVTVPINPQGFDVTAWNGITMVNGAIDPANVVPFEFESAGTEPVGAGMRRAVPEGSLIVDTHPAGSRLCSFLIVGNYCGRDAAGHLLVQNISGLPSVTETERVHVDYYEYLADWLDVIAPFSDPPSLDLNLFPLGPEVPRGYFTCPGGPDAVECANASVEPSIDTIEGNKLRPVVVVTVAAGLPNAGRKLLVAGLNLDPIDPLSYDSATKMPLDGPINQGNGRDDGKYDYLAFTDITDMVTQNPPPEGTWHFQDIGSWRSKTKFLRLPPDVSAGWNYTMGPNPQNSGHDWSEVAVVNPDPLGGSNRQVPIVGSGTIKSLAADPTGQYLYVVSSDQHQENVIENATLGDGGWHIPHLYKINLGVADFTDQVEMNAYAPNIEFWRLPKVINEQFLTVAPPSGQHPSYWGSTLVRPTIPDFPMEAMGGQWTGPTRVSEASCAEIGEYYPGEYQLDPTARTKLVIVRNDNLASHPVRMYIGTTGQAQTSDTGMGEGALGLDLPGFIVGGLYVISLGVPGNSSYGDPVYRKTLTLWQDTVVELGSPDIDPYIVAGFKVLPPRTEFLGSNLARNVLVVSAASIKQPGTAGPVDRLTLVQDQ